MSEGKPQTPAHINEAKGNPAIAAVATQKATPTKITAHEYTDVKEIDPLLVNLGKETYLSYKSHYDSNNWLTSVTIWDNLSDKDKLFWINLLPQSVRKFRINGFA